MFILNSESITFMAEAHASVSALTRSLMNEPGSYVGNIIVFQKLSSVYVEEIY